MAGLYWQRDIGDTINDAKDTFSSWDSCMSKDYCKWPTIIGIILASLIVISLFWCLFRCLCCGAECCCGCLSCCNACCPSPRRKGNQGYQHAPPTPNPFYNQYQPPNQGPVYASGGMGFRSANVPQTATFDAPSKNGAHYNEDALPAMPSWNDAPVRRVEVQDEVEMEKLDHERAQSPNTAAGAYAAHQNLLPEQETGRYYDPGRQESPHGGDVGGMSANPYHDHAPRRQISSPSPYPMERPGASSPYAPAYQNTTSPAPYSGANNSYFGGGSHSNPYAGEQHSGYEPSIPPSYRSQPSNMVSPVSPQGQSPYPRESQYQPYGNVRQPAPGSWREV